jgi:hypothetical protein
MTTRLSCPAPPGAPRVPHQAANEAIAKLVKDGILEEMTGRNYARLFASRRVLRILEG